MSNAMKLLMALEIGGAIYLVSMAARAQEQQWRYQAKRVSGE